MVPVKRYVNGICKRPFLKGRWHLVFTLLFAVMLILLIRSFLFIQVEVPISREDLGLLEGDRVVVNRMSYGLRCPHSPWWSDFRWGECHPVLGDLVAYDYPDRSGRISIDRVLALPGDTLWLDEDAFTVVPFGTYGIGNFIIPERQIMGRPVYVSYSIDATQPFYKLMRRNRLFVKIR